MQVETIPMHPIWAAPGFPAFHWPQNPRHWSGLCSPPREGMRREEVEPRTSFQPLSRTCVPLGLSCPRCQVETATWGIFGLAGGPAAP